MLNAGRLVTVLAILGALGATTAQAQAFGPRSSDLFTVNVYGGGYSPTSSLAVGHEFENSGAVGGAVTIWVNQYMGVRGNVLYARTDISSGAPAPLAGEDPSVWAYSGDLILRHGHSSHGGGGTLFPYIVAGLGGKTYDFDRQGTETDFAGNFGAGVEYRFARWGVQAE
jgi:hypothetical protein